MEYKSHVVKEVKVGDKILITEEMDAHGKYKTGDVLTVKEVLHASRVMVEEHDRVIHFMEFEVVKEDKPKFGDKIRITDACLSDGKYKNGDIMTVSKVFEDGSVLVFEHDIGISSFEFEVIRQEDGIRVGSLIRIDNPAESGGYYKKGDVLTVSRIHRSTEVPYVIVEEFIRPIHFYEFRLLSAKNTKVGDKIRITHATMPAGKYKNGDVLTVSNTSFDSEGVIKWVYVEGLDCFPILRQEFEVLSEESQWTPVTDERGSKLKELDSRLSKVESEISAHASQITQCVQRHEIEVEEESAGPVDIADEIASLERKIKRAMPAAHVNITVDIQMHNGGLSI